MYKHNSTPEEIRALALAVESSIMHCLSVAREKPEQEEHWRRHADRMEQKFSNEFGEHYSHFLYPVEN